MSVGSYTWGGAFYTNFWVDPKKELVVVMMTQVALPWGDLKLIEDLTEGDLRGAGGVTGADAETAGP